MSAIASPNIILCAARSALTARIATIFFLTFAIIAIPFLAPAQISTETEPNNSDLTANGPVGAGVFVAGTIANSSDIDFFAFTAPGAGRLSVGVHGPRGDQYTIAIHDSLGNLITQSNTSSRPEFTTVTLAASASGVAHTIRVERVATEGASSAATDYQLSLAFIDTSARPTKPGSITNYFTGTSADSANDPIGGPAIMAMGGGSEVDNQFRDNVWPILNRGNIVVVRASGSNGYQSYLSSDIPNLFSPARTPASVETIIINSTTKANTDYTSWVVSRAELVWFAGGDQSDYVNYYKNTNLERAVNQAYARGAVIGGTSAGAMILGQYVYDPDGVTAVTSAQAVNNPYHPSVLLTTDLFEFPIMKNIIVESHTLNHSGNPSRLGRSAAFMARLKTDYGATKIFLVAPDEDGGIFINRDRIGTTTNSPVPVWILAEDATTNLTRCLSGQTLIYENLIRWRGTGSSPAGQSYDFNDQSRTGGIRIRATINNNTYTPTDWYAAGTDDPTAPVTLTTFTAE